MKEAFEKALAEIGYTYISKQMRDELWPLFKAGAESKDEEIKTLKADLAKRDKVVANAMKWFRMKGALYADPKRALAGSDRDLFESIKETEDNE